LRSPWSCWRCRSSSSSPEPSCSRTASSGWASASA